MPRIRDGAPTNATIGRDVTAGQWENTKMNGTAPSSSTKTEQTSGGQKRKSGVLAVSDDDHDTKRIRESIETPGKKSGGEPRKHETAIGIISEVENPESKPRLTTPDLEFDYDRSQLRDPRPTPGRVKRPRYGSFDLPEDIKARFYIPKIKMPKGRLSAREKSLLYDLEQEIDPSATFRHDYRCLKKGRGGSPTYDPSGFELDYEKVLEWDKPMPRKKSMVRGMERALERHRRENQVYLECFFVDGQGPTGIENSTWVDYMKDHVSKDLGVPYHQIGPDHVRDWAAKGFQKVKADEWWRTPNAEERKRMLKLMTGSSLRKDI